MQCSSFAGAVWSCVKVHCVAVALVPLLWGFAHTQHILSSVPNYATQQFEFVGEKKEKPLRTRTIAFTHAPSLPMIQSTLINFNIIMHGVTHLNKTLWVMRHVEQRVPSSFVDWWLCNYLHPCIIPCVCKPNRTSGRTATHHFRKMFRNGKSLCASEWGGRVDSNVYTTRYLPILCEKKNGFWMNKTVRTRT